ncbi:MAG: hypothetical protein EZS28_012021 [Streblomastix strix]|uniref:Uncharacterized protein n=1 Tax=Streblomastix strix TaxID=222440 RepID=A0A5J4WCQ8_9EUKA|nr:MAG: hypothetical protein EZS28_012021 [Streblomastix strix]
MIPPEKPDIIFLRNCGNVAYNSYAVRIVNMEGKPHTQKFPTSTISQIKDAKFDKLDISNINFNMENEEAIIDLIRAQKLINFPPQIIHTQSTNFPFGGFDENGENLQSIMSFANIKAMFDLIIDQRHLIPEAYASLNPMVCGQIESDKDYYGQIGAGYLQRENIFYQTTLYRGSKATKVYYPNKFMLAWRMATDDSFIVTFDDARDPQVLTLEVIGEIGGTMVRAG